MSTTTKNTPAKGIMLYGSMGTWLNEFLQNAAFPAVVLAFACSPINNEIPDVRTGRSTDPRRAEKTLISYIDHMNREGWYQPPKGPALKQDRGT